MFACCVFIPLSLFLVVGPIWSAAHGPRRFGRTVVVELGLLVVVLLSNFPATVDLVTDWRDNAMYLLPIALVLTLPIVMGLVVLYVRAAEGEPDANVCRTCGYDLRASPVRCPECGTRVRRQPAAEPLFPALARQPTAPVSTAPAGSPTGPPRVLPFADVPIADIIPRMTTTRTLGRSDISVAGPLAFGGNVFGWTVDEATSFALLDAFVDAGLNFIDTADVYSRWKPGHSGGESEEIIGRWLKRSGKRERVILATKVGMDMGGDDKGLAPAYIARAVEKSLSRLGVDRIDLYQSHKDDEATPQAETLGAYAKLIEAGKVRAIGASNFTATRLAEALRLSADQGLPRYESLQPEYNLMERTGYEAELEPLCRREDVGVITYFSLASGFLTGKYRSEADLKDKARGKGAGKYMNGRGSAVLSTLDAVAAEHRSTPARVAIAWILARPGVTAPIASATSLAQLEDLIAATKLELTPQDVQRLNSASA